MEIDHAHSDCCPDGNLTVDIFGAVKSGILIAVQDLVIGSSTDILNTFDKEGNTPAHYACAKGFKLILEFIIESGGWFNEPSQNDKGQRPIHLAAFEGHCSVVELLLQHGVSVDVQDIRGRTPLISSAQTGNCSMAAFLIARGASKFLLDNEGDSPLHWAAHNGHAEMVRMLVYFGYNPEQHDHHLQRPIHLSSLRGKIEVVRDLCNIDKVDINVEDENGFTPLSLAIKKKQFNVSAFLKQVSRRNKKLPLPTSFKSVLDGSFLAASQDRLYLFLICFILFYGYPVYIFQIFFTTWNELFLLHLLFIICNTVFWISFVKTHNTDPGFLAKEDDKYAWTMENISSYQEIGNATAALSRLCHSCRIVRPLRSKHCRTCNRCVEVFDHHCFYVSNCIGVKNRVWFVIFVASTFITGVISIAFCYHNYVTGHQSILINIGFTVVLGGTGLASVIFVFIIITINSGLTTNERANWHRYNYLLDAKGRLANPYDKGFLHNLLDYFHLRGRQEKDALEMLIV